MPDSFHLNQELCRDSALYLASYAKLLRSLDVQFQNRSKIMRSQSERFLQGDDLELPHLG
jgi:hypothetical protein